MNSKPHVWAPRGVCWQCTRCKRRWKPSMTDWSRRTPPSAQVCPATVRG